MRKLFFILIIFSFDISVSAQETVLFENHEIGLAFNGDAKWKVVGQNGEDVLELVNNNNNLKVTMWQVKTPKNAIEYLPELICSDGLISYEGPFQTEIDQKTAYGLIAMCSEMRRPVKMLLIAYSTEDGVNVIRFKCSEECFQNHRQQMNELIQAVKILDKAESHLYFANNKVKT